MAAIGTLAIIERKKRQIASAEFMLGRFDAPETFSPLTPEAAEQWRTKLAELRSSLAMLEA